MLITNKIQFEFMVQKMSNYKGKLFHVEFEVLISLIVCLTSMNLQKKILKNPVF
jgi:hypothetical protein